MTYSSICRTIVSFPLRASDLLFERILEILRHSLLFPLNFLADKSALFDKEHQSWEVNHLYCAD